MKRVCLLLLRGLRGVALAGLLLTVQGRADAEPRAAEAEPSRPGSGAGERAKDRLEALPKRLEGIDIIERLDTQVPAGLEFTDEQGQKVRLGDYFKGDVPMILSLNYSGCPMLCSVQLNGFVKGLKGLEWTAGKEFRIVTVSLDPAETFETAKKTQAKYIGLYGRPEAAAGWHFLTGSEYNVRQLAAALGFDYGYNEARKEYVHAAAIVLGTPDGRIARYLYGVEYLPKTLRLSLAEASEGKIGSSMDKLLLYCFYYDSSEGRYAPMARNIMSLGGGIATCLLAGFLGVLWRGERRRTKTLAAKLRLPREVFADFHGSSAPRESTAQ